MIPVTKPFLPPKSEYDQFIQGVWHRGWLTNHGPLVREFRENLKNYLNLSSDFLFTNNGTVAIQLAIEALDLTGEVITTPFSYVATTSSIVWQKCIPVFADIDEYTFNINPEKVEPLINSKTTAIVATHVFGNPCDNEGLTRIAKDYKLKLIYDAAHGFGTKLNDKCIYEFGDISIGSFHATKLFHTIEGGGFFCNSEDILLKATRLMTFGHDADPYRFKDAGINGKNCEFHAAMGLCNLKYVDLILQKRKSDYTKYKEYLKGLNLGYQTIQYDCTYNYAYFPVVFESESFCLKVLNSLEKEHIFPRRYFYPSLNTLHYVKNNKMPVSESVASRILCLPLYYDLQEKDIEHIATIVRKVVNM